MRISDLRTGVVGTPWRNLTYVELQTDEGLSGVGEVRMVAHTEALLGYLAESADRYIVGADPFEIEKLVTRMYREDYGRPGEVAMSSIAIVEMACWDIVGKALGQPVHRLLGGAVRDRVKAYANGWYTTERTPEEFHGAARAVVERGYRALKLDPFGAGFAEIERSELLTALSLVEAVRDAVGPEVEILIEMHGRFTPAVALRVARALEPFEPSWIEEPVPPENLAALEKVSRAARIPVATGERIHTRYEYRELFERQAADVLQPDVGHFGGLWETRKLAATAETHYMLMAPHNVAGAVLTAANVHLAACVPNFKIQEHFNDFADPYVKDVAPGCPQVDPADGCFPVPTAPGLGVELDWDAMAEHPRRSVHFNLYAEDWHRRGRTASASG
jgi:galactonate dehydratase